MNFNIKKTNGGLFADDRGFLRFVNDFDFSNVKRFYQVENHSKNYIRAWHGHLKEGKYVYVAKGTALVGAVDLTTEEVNKFVISSQSPAILYIPPGYANGFKSLEEDTIIMFFSTSTLEESKGDDIRYEWDKWNIWEEDYR
jgi:dTDP-4-dehydrorhamnose 3,5-epimerase-like enzyme